MFRKLFLGFIFPFKWNRALDLVAEGNAEIALEVINSIQYAGGMSLEVDILRAHALKEVGKHRESFFLCKGLLSRINDTKRYNENDRSYLMSYVSWVANMNIDSLGGDFRELHKFWNLNIERIELDSVSSHFKTKFPLRCHPKWIE